MYQICKSQNKSKNKNMKKIIKKLHKINLTSKYQVSCIFILLKNNTTQHTLHAHAHTCSLQNHFFLLSSCHVTGIPYNPLRQCECHCYQNSGGGKYIAETRGIGHGSGSPVLYIFFHIL